VLNLNNRLAFFTKYFVCTQLQSKPQIVNFYYFHLLPKSKTTQKLFLKIFLTDVLPRFNFNLLIIFLNFLICNYLSLYIYILQNFQKSSFFIKNIFLILENRKRKAVRAKPFLSPLLNLIRLLTTMEHR